MENPQIQKLREALEFSASYRSAKHPGADAIVMASQECVRIALAELDMLRAQAGEETPIYVIGNGSTVTGARAAQLLDHEMESHAATRKENMELRKRLGEGVGRLDMGNVSDGYHTFNELYDHRCTLFLALMKQRPEWSWISTKHEDGTLWDGWFIAGMKLPTGDTTYHLPTRMWSLACETGAAILETGMHWDGHTPAQVVERIQAWTSLASSK